MKSTAQRRREQNEHREGLAPMQWPDTVAASVRGEAAFELGTAASAARSEQHRSSASTAVDVLGAVNVLDAVDMVGAFSGLELPCRREPDLFFAESPEDLESAKALCRGCPARLACLAGAVERREPWGVWGGELFLRGEIVPRKRPRGRPRKTEVAA
jgi:WhiB family transcriptional regulator, redox-sensing transcriptional regulator